MADDHAVKRAATTAIARAIAALNQASENKLASAVDCSPARASAASGAAWKTFTISPTKLTIASGTGGVPSIPSGIDTGGYRPRRGGCAGNHAATWSGGGVGGYPVKPFSHWLMRRCGPPLSARLAKE
eukprot:CAMPEP_0114231514 /NCGR_PEP_ID=MMETSP0058-20121206/4087_1 /TAXON_ID=36894 /ORGANISM="Pyramimonas parkeae, CCMP726" /LENGTH=127 /DNA_ID=CAMNT_0001342873 /DNA_START=402 /DNA_END=785 /DNA_ORIENTATION=+